MLLASLGELWKNQSHVLCLGLKTDLQLINQLYHMPDHQPDHASECFHLIKSPKTEQLPAILTYRINRYFIQNDYY